MDVEKTRGANSKVSISPSRALVSEAERQVDNGMWDSKTDFFEAGAWLLVELQTLGVDLLEGDVSDDNRVVPREAQALVTSEANLSLHVHHEQRDDQQQTTDNDDDNDN